MNDKPTDDMFHLNETRKLGLGNGTDMLNLIIMLPKTETRAKGSGVTIEKVLESRIGNAGIAETLAQQFMNKNSHHIRRMKIRVKVSDVETGQLLCSSVSGSVGDSNSLRYGMLDLYDCFPLVSCERGWRKITMLTEFTFGPNILPLLQLYLNGERVGVSEERKLSQPNPEDVVVIKSTVIFMTPKQDFVGEFLSRGYEIKLAVKRGASRPGLKRRGDAMREGLECSPLDEHAISEGPTISKVCIQ